MCQDDAEVYDPLNRVRKVTRPDGGWTKYTFGDAVGNLFKLIETKQDATRSTKAYEYFDPLGRTSRIFVSELGADYIANDVIYDQMGRTWKASNPYRTATRDGVADITHTSHWTITTYDSLGRVNNITLPDSSVVQTSYQGVYTTVTDQAGKLRRQKVDALGRIERVDEPDVSGSLGALDSPAQPTFYWYDTQGNLVHIAQGSGTIQHRYFKYDALGRLTHERQVEQAAVFTASDPATGNSQWSRKLVYDETIGNVTYSGLLTTAHDARSIQTYDSLGRLSSGREFPGNNTQPSYVVNYDYDVFGNRYQKQLQNPGNPFTQVWVEAAHLDLATNRFNSGVTYDNAGNVTIDSKFRNRKFEYDANNRQKRSRNLDNSGAVDSVFDATGQRVATLVGGSLTNVLVYDAMGTLLAEYNSTTSQGGTQFIFDDHQGTPRAITNNAGAVVVRHDYLPFGEDIPNNLGMRTTGQGYGETAEAARQKYAGMESNEATGMAHTLWRQYDALSGRWTAPDPYKGSMSVDSPQSLNRYSYVDNDPVNQVDPSGLMGQIADASMGWGDVSEGFWGGSLDGGLRPQNHIGLALLRHDSIIETGYDPAFGRYRGPVLIECIPVSGDFSIARTLEDPTQEAVDVAMESMANAGQLVAQGGGGRRPPPRQPTVRGDWVVGKDARPLRAPANWHKHHLFPQQFRSTFESKGINIDNVTLMLPSDVHARLHGPWNHDWASFLRSPRSQQEIYKFGIQMMMRHNLETYMIMKYK